MYSLALAILLGSQAIGTAADSIDFELYNGRIYVPVFVNGHGPYRFAVDTGASGIGRADVRLAEEEALPAAGQVANSDGVKTVSTAVVTAKSIRLGDLELADAELLSRDYNRNLKPGASPMMGILGRDFFKDRLLVIDYPARKIRFGKGTLPAGGANVIAYGPSLSVPVCVATGCVSGKVDTGSNRTLVIPAALVPKVKASPPMLVGQVARTNSDAKLYEMSLVEDVRVGSVTARHQKIFYAEPSVDNVNIGSDFLKDYVLTIDQANQRLKIERPAAN